MPAPIDHLCDRALMTHTHMAKRTAAGTLALAVCLGGGALALAGSAQAETPEARDRVIIVTTGAQPYDALAAAPLATMAAAPILLQAPGQDLDPTIAYFLQRAVEQQDRVTYAYVLGGEAAVSPGVEKQLFRAGVKVHRVSGQDRYATALNIALETELLLDDA